MNPLWSEAIRDLTPYVPGEQPDVPGLIKLNTNENPYPPSPAVLAAIQQAAGADLRLYPAPDSATLRHAIADLHGLSPDHVFLGNGSDEVLAHAFLALLKHKRPLLFPDVSYSFYPVYCKLYGIDYATVPVDDALRVQLGDYLRPNGGIVLANPNAPTGRALARKEIESLLQANTASVVVVDEAYVDFGAESVIPLVRDFSNLLVVHTLSKSRSLAGLRVGFAIGHPSLVEALNRVKGSFNSYPLDRLAIAGAIAAIHHQGYFERCCAKVIASRDRLADSLQALGFAVVPSSSNFLFVRHPAHDAVSLLARLRARKILVRHFAKPRIEQYLRISIGTEEECKALVAALREILSLHGGETKSGSRD